MSINIKPYIRDVPDFPVPGILFKDITPLLADPTGFELVIAHLAEKYRDVRIGKIVAVESRGFIFGAALANRLRAGFVPARKPGKLPAEKISVTYQLEYGEDRLEMHRDALAPGERVLILDDLLATGGTLQAAARLVRQLEGEIVGIATIIELTFLNGRAKLPADAPYYSIMQV